MLELPVTRMTRFAEITCRTEESSDGEVRKLTDELVRARSPPIVKNSDAVQPSEPSKLTDTQVPELSPVKRTCRPAGMVSRMPPEVLGAVRRLTLMLARAGVPLTVLPSWMYAPYAQPLVPPDVRTG